jgi:hypothetical protein
MLRKKIEISNIALILFLTLIAGFLSGCGKPYIITQELKVPVSTNKTCAIGSIIDELPADFDAAKKPSEEEINKLKDCLYKAVEKERLLEMVGIDAGRIDYKIQGSVLDYAKGSGFLRFMVGFGAGSAKVTIGLRLIDTKTDEIIYGGNFIGTVSSWAASGDQMFKIVSGNFVKELKKELKKMEKEGK